MRVETAQEDRRFIMIKLVVVMTNELAKRDTDF